MPKSVTAIALSAVLIIAVVALLPCLKNDFTSWDDGEYLLRNPVIRSLSPGNIKTIFTSFFLGNYQPLSMLSYSLEYHFFGLNPLIYHLSNFLLHLVNTFLVFWLVFLLSGRLFVPFAAALLFAVHPLHVESVAWVSERKDVLYACFFFLAAISYAYYLKKGLRRRYYDLCLCCFVLSLLSKGMAFTLPLVLLLIDYLLGRRLSRAVFVEKAPFFILSFIFGAIAVFAQYSLGAVRQEHFFNLADKAIVAAYGVTFYLWKIFLPFKLSCLYPYPFGAGHLWNTAYIICLFAVVILVCLTALSARFTRKVVFGFAFFLITLLPGLQFVPLGSAVVADRYTYVSALGIFFLAAEFLQWLYLKKLSHARLLRVFAWAVFLGAIGIFSVLTQERCGVWKDNLSLWNNAVENYPLSHLARLRRGLAYARVNEDRKAFFDLALALELYYKQIGVKREYGRIYNNISPVYSPAKYAEAYNLFGVEFAQLGGAYTHFAIDLFRRGIELYPRDARIYSNCAAAYGERGRYQDAADMARKAMEIDPHSPDANYNLAVAYYFSGRQDLARQYLNTATKLGAKPTPEFQELIKRGQNQ